MLATVTEAKGRLEEAAGRGILESRASGRQGNLFMGARLQRGKKIEQISACSIMDLSLFFNFKEHTCMNQHLGHSPALPL